MDHVSNHNEICGSWKIVFRHPGALAGAFLAGGILAFAYSYVPLHGAKNWKIDYQESRLESQRGELVMLQAKLATVESEAGRAAQLEDEQAPRRQELDDALAKLKAAEAKYAELKKENSKLARSRDSWRSRHASSEKELGALKAQTEERDSQQAPSPASQPAAAPAGDSAAASPAQHTVNEGARWTSPDASASFTLVSASDGRATLRLGDGGETIRVETGSNIRIGDPARGSYRVTIMQIEAGRSIGISAEPEDSNLLLAPGVASPAP